MTDMSQRRKKHKASPEPEMASPCPSPSQPALPRQQTSSNPWRIGYQGEPGAYSEASLLEYFGLKLQEVIPVPFESFDAVHAAVKSGVVEKGFVPIENSLGGSIHQNFDLLVRGDLQIQGEHNFRVRHSLMALPGVKIQDIKHAWSHPQALAQCEEFMKNAGIQAVKQYDTAGSAKMLAEQKLTNVAAIASTRAASYYGLTVLAEGIEDENTNYTRFLLLGREETTPLIAEGGQFKSSIAFALNDEPGCLFKCISAFALRDISLSKIESRPGKNLEKAMLFNHRADIYSTEEEEKAPAAAAATDTEKKMIKASFPYFFFVDVMGHVQEQRMKNALRALAERTPFLRVLGSYKASADTEEIAKPGVPSPLDGPKLKIGIVGFGTFGQFLAKAFVELGHAVFAQSRGDYTELANGIGVSYFTDVTELFKQGLDVVVMCMSIISFEDIMKKLPWDKACDCLIVDVLSVKMHPKEVLVKHVPAGLDILCTHPMFGPESGKYSWKSLPMMFDKVRIEKQIRCDAFLNIFRTKGCRMLQMSCELHDAYAAGSQFITHTTGRVLSKLGLESTPINTKGFESLLKLIENTSKDSFDLFHGLFKFNPHAEAQINGFQQAFEDVKNRLLSTDSNMPDNGPVMVINPRVTAMQESKTAQVSDLATKLKREGKDIISLSIGEPDTPTPTPIVMAVIKAMMDGKTKYTETTGLQDLRQEICLKLKRDNGLTYTPEQIVVSNGAKQSVMQTIMALSNPGDEVLIPAPYWVSYPEMCTLSGSKPVIIPTAVEDNFVLMPNALENAITPRSKVLILCSPSNPTGSVISKEQLEALVSVLAKHPHIFVVSDEIYEYILYDGAKHVSIASLPGMYARTIVINGMSKAFSMTGFRVGYSASNLRLAQTMGKIQGQITSCPNSISQYGAIAGLQMGMKPVNDMVAQLDGKKKIVFEALDSVEGLVYSKPQGAFYVFPVVKPYYGKWAPKNDALGLPAKQINNSEDLCLYLLEQHNLALVPGSAFGDPACLRIAFATAESTLRNAMTKFVTGLRALK